MKSKKMREARFKSYAEEAEYWDKADTSAQMEDDDAWFTFDVVPEEERCPRCGSQMRVQTIDLHLLRNRLTLHRVNLNVCPTCQYTKMPREVEEFSKEIEATAVKTGLARQAV